MKKHGRTQITNSTWHGPTTWPDIRADAQNHGRIRVLSVDRKTGSLVVETFGKLNWANYNGEWKWRHQ